MDIVNLALLWSKGSTWFKRTPIILVSDRSKVTCLNEHRSVVPLTSTVVKCFKMLVVKEINSFRISDLVLLQLTSHHNRGTEDVISLPLHSVLEHLDNRSINIGVSYIDCSWHTIIPSKPIVKLNKLVLFPSPCNCILDF